MGLKERQEVLNKPKLILYKLFKENFQTEEARNTLINKAMEIMPEFPTLNSTHKIKVLTSNINLICNCILFEGNVE